MLITILVPLPAILAAIYIIPRMVRALPSHACLHRCVHRCLTPNNTGDPLPPRPLALLGGPERAGLGGRGTFARPFLCVYPKNTRTYMQAKRQTATHTIVHGGGGGVIRND